MSRHSSRGKAWDRQRLRVLNRDGFVCAYCGRDATTADHVIPKAAGGTDEMSNLVAACKPCNNAKGDKVVVRTAYYDPAWLDHA